MNEINEALRRIHEFEDEQIRLETRIEELELKIEELELKIDNPLIQIHHHYHQNNEEIEEAVRESIKVMKDDRRMGR